VENAVKRGGKYATRIMIRTRTRRSCVQSIKAASRDINKREARRFTDFNVYNVVRPSSLQDGFSGHLEAVVGEDEKVGLACAKP
jgi:hypothetical protein